jgi:hypothetical protein
VDEKPVVLHADVRPPRPMRSGLVARRDCEYERRGTANVFCGVQPKAGRPFTKPTANRSSPQFADYLVEIVASYPEAETIHLVMGNLSSHNRKALVDRFGEKIGGLLWERFTVHYTPKHGSWLNQSLEPKDEPPPRHHQLAVHAQEGTPEVRLRMKQHHTVRDQT